MERRLRVVSIGGGSGQSVVLRALREMPVDITAIVAMADDGGSTGILRRDTHTPAPGDIRKCLVALAEDPNSMIAQLFAHRMIKVENHALGNLILCSLTEETGDFATAIKHCERELQCRGHVLPSTLSDVRLSGRTSSDRVVQGQAHLTQGKERLNEVWLEPHNAPAYPPCLSALNKADFIVLGPGSLFTSLIPNILLTEIADALNQSSAKLCFICPKADTPGETYGMSVHDYVVALRKAGLTRVVDAVLVHKEKLPEADSAHSLQCGCESVQSVICDTEVLQALEGIGRVLTYDFNAAHPYQHDIIKLRSALSEVIACLLPQNQKTSSLA